MFGMIVANVLHIRTACCTVQLESYLLIAQSDWQFHVSVQSLKALPFSIQLPWHHHNLPRSVATKALLLLTLYTGVHFNAVCILDCGTCAHVEAILQA